MEAKKDLTKSLLANTKLVHRPVMLGGYSFRALVIYSCLLELAWYQEECLKCQEDDRTAVPGVCHLEDKSTVDFLSALSLEQTNE